MSKPYDAKKSVWVPADDKEKGFLEGLIESDDGKKAVVMVGHEVLNNDRKYRTNFQCQTTIVNLLFLCCRKKPSRATKLDRSTHQNSKNVRTWQI